MGVGEHRDFLSFYLNGREKVVRNVEPETTILQYVRREGLTGTKLGCGEGGCGACTVMVSSYDHDAKTIRHSAVNACLAPLCSVDSCHVTTVEGIGSMRRGLHPVQQRISAMHGSQCGFCTPGIVMALYALLRAHPNATKDFVEENLDGNLCRCTGYRPILDAAKSLASDGRVGCCRGATGGGVGCPCMSVKQNGTGDSADSEDSDEEHASGAAGGAAVPTGLAGTAGVREIAECTGSRARLPEFSAPYSDSAEPIFPPKLMLSRPPALQVRGRNSCWFAPTSLSELLELKAEHPAARLVVGNTEVGIETKFKGVAVPVIICPSRVPEMAAITSGKEGLEIGGAATLAALEHALAAEIEKRPAEETSGFRAAKDMLRWFASNQIRNVAALAGNLATASPISDMNPLLAAVGSVLTLASTEGRRQVKVSDFFLGYRKVDLKPSELILSISLPTTRRYEFVLPFKQARRREDDISIVTATIRLVLEPSNISKGSITSGNGSLSSSNGGNGFWRVSEAALGFGGLAPTTVLAKKTAAHLAGKEWCEKTLEGAYETLAEEFNLPVEVPGGQSEFRRALAPSFMFKAFVQTSIDLEEIAAGAAAAASSLPPPPVVDAAEKSAARNFVSEPKPASRGQQTYVLQTDGGLQKARPVPHAPDDEGTTRAPVGLPIPHKAAPMQVAGEAEYTDDIPAPPGTLHAALVMSTRPHARLVSIDAGPALAAEGVKDFFTARDVTGDNALGPVVKDEEAFASSEVHCVGQVIGIIVADTTEQAQAAAKLVQIEYEDLPTVLSIDDAIATNSFFDQFHIIEDGDVEAALAKDGVVTVEGEMRIGSQEHFYLETNATLAVPTEGGGLEVFASTQAPNKTQAFCAHVCGIPSSRVVCRVKRMGGGFGGKETRSVFISVVVALAAHLTGKPVRISLDRDVDMQTTGQRHAFMAKYKAGAYPDGRLAGMDVKIYDNIGCSLDLSGAVTDRALFHVDNCCRWPALRCRGFMAKTNQSSHTAYRGFGAPQGMLICETVLDHLASTLRMPLDDLRDRNLYKEGELTHFGMPIDAWNVPAGLQELKESADIDNRRKAIEQFNKENRWRKRGLGVMPTKFGISFTAKFMNQGGALVHLYTDGTVLVSHGGTEMGQGLHTKVIQVAARSFGISEDQVHIAETSTDKVPNSSPTAASMSTDLYGMATLDACEQIKERLRPVAEKMPGADLRAVAQAAYMLRVNLSAQGFYCVPSERCGYDWSASVAENAQRGQPFNYFTQGVAASEVEIDVLTGDARILRADIVMDLGASINPAIDIGQVEGAFVQGYGWCTMEEIIWGDNEHKWVRPGQMLTRGPGAYKLPAFNDVPSDFRIRLMRGVGNPFAVHSSKAVGEPPFFLASSAFFAIKEAIRAARIDAGASPVFALYSPASSERIRTACADKFVARFTNISKSGENGEKKGSEEFQARGSW